MRAPGFGVVFRFELARTLRRKTFWIAAIAAPLVLGVLVLILIAGSKQSAQGGQDPQAVTDFLYTDASGYIDHARATDMGGSLAASEDQAIGQIEDGSAQAYFAFPEDPSTNPVQVYGQDLGFAKSQSYGAAADRLLDHSVSNRIGSKELVNLAAGSATFETHTYTSGKITGGIAAAIPPSVMALLFLTVVLFLGPQLLTSSVEEKENRISEMILTSTTAGVLLFAKICAVAVTGLIQLSVPVLFGMIGWAAVGSLIPISGGAPGTVMLLACGSLTVAGLLLFAGALVIIGALMPTAKEASAVFGVLLLCLLVPVYAVPILGFTPDSAMANALELIPFTAPVAVLVEAGSGVASAGYVAGTALWIAVAGGALLLAGLRLYRRGILPRG